jgi:hypothetical protein
MGLKTNIFPKIDAYSGNLNLITSHGILGQNNIYELNNVSLNRNKTKQSVANTYISKLVSMRKIVSANYYL